jgi:hypothetical protein
MTYAPRRVSRSARTGIRFVPGLAGVPMPLMELETADANRVIATLVRSGDEAVERDGHLAGDAGHRDQDYGSGPESPVWMPVDEPFPGAQVDKCGTGPKLVPP